MTQSPAGALTRDAARRQVMKPCRNALVIGAAALLGIACDKPAGRSLRSDSSVATVREKPAVSVSAAGGSFAYVDSSGTQLLALDSVPDPSAIRGAVCQGNPVFPVRYDRRQTRQPADNGRDIADNFRNRQGDVFRITHGSASPDKTCYLSRDSVLLANASPVALRKPEDCSAVDASRVTAAKRRQIIHCWQFASAPAGLEVLAVQFANVDSNALASLALVSDSSLWFRDFPAVYNEESTWRVDDGGVFSPADFNILFAAPLTSGYVMAIAWAGAEGESSELVVADSTDAFRILSKGYRYWAPT